MLSLFIKRATAIVGTIAFWVWAIANAAVNWIGKSTTADDAEQLVLEKLPAWANWLFSTPWWAPSACAVILTAWLIWITLPSRGSSQQAKLKGNNQVVGVKSRNPNNDELVEVKDKSFINETVILDGHRHIGCTFVNVRMKYNGGSFGLEHNKMRGVIFITDSQEIENAWSLLKSLGFITLKSTEELSKIHSSTNEDKARRTP